MKMNRKMMVSAAAAVVAFAAFGATTVSDVVARQRWPWSEKVDIDYTLTGDKGDVTFSATWDGQSTPVILGTEFQVEAGQHRFEWCPTNNYAGQTLTGFTVTAEAGSAADHKYLILDLKDGGYSFMAAPPEGGWTDEYKSTKMVFARCPAGTYTNGVYYKSADKKGDMIYVSKGNSQWVEGDALSYLYALAAAKRTITLTSDWYVGIYHLTVAQYNQIQNGSATSDYTRKGIAYNALRGRLDDSPAVNWPITKYNVSDNSFVKKLRDKTGGALCIDLPQEEQYEVALRSGAATFWANGGSSSDSLEQLTNYVNEVVNWYYSNGGLTTLQPVGMKSANAWGIFDLGGGDWCLDTANRVTSGSADRGMPSSTPSHATDPVGATLSPGDSALNGKSIKRIVRASEGYAASAKLVELMPSYRWLYTQDQVSPTVRFAIHLKPLNFGD